MREFPSNVTPTNYSLFNGINLVPYANYRYTVSRVYQMILNSIITILNRELENNIVLD